ncbi:hypothetical protein FQA39_LY00276 [Lamprigera yunnana]|nr:hypothetical protein FQA39_LY00276 [Lamprigera yunnana]
MILEYHLVERWLNSVLLQYDQAMENAILRKAMKGETETWNRTKVGEYRNFKEFRDRLEANNNSEFNCKSSHVPVKYKEKVKDLMLGGSIIERAQTRFMNTIDVVRKKKTGFDFVWRVSKNATVYATRSVGSVNLDFWGIL